LLVLLATIEHLGGTSTKRDIELFIQGRRFLELTDRNLDRTATSKEPRWQNELAWARKDAVLQGYLQRVTARGVWQISKKGMKRLDQYRERLRSGGAKLRPSRLLTQEFVDWFCPASKQSGPRA
jgi:hypothetical protein